MKINILLTILAYYLFNNAYSQENLIYTGNYIFLGYKYGQPVFRIYREAKAFDNGLYSLHKGDYELYGFKLLDTVKVKGNLHFVSENLIVSHFYDQALKGRWINVFDNEVLLDSVLINNEFEVSFSVSENILFISVGTELYSKLAYLDLNEDIPKIKLTPLFVTHHFISHDWVYFSYDRVNYGYSPYPDDIFRVKMFDWQNPELIITGIERSGWYLFPNTNILYAHADLGKEKKNYDMLYNAESKYQEIESMGYKTIIKLNNLYFFTKKKKSKGYETIGLTPLPKLPTLYPYKDTRRILPREIWYNVPLKEKSFKGTFITSELLRQALREELEKLEKPQLRLLRNAIYAQQAYIFESKDLQDFFNQFEWYRMMTNKKTSNEDVVILPEDKERANLILEIEQSK